MRLLQKACKKIKPAHTLLYTLLTFYCKGPRDVLSGGLLHIELRREASLQRIIIRRTTQHKKSMKKYLCLLLCLLCAVSCAACGKKDVPAPRLWCVSPGSISAENEIKQLIRHYDSNVYVSFVPEEELDSRLNEAVKRGDSPDVFMLHADAIPDLVEDKKLADLTDRLRVSRVKSDELSDASRRACAYQGKNWAAPLFVDVYMLATNRALVSVPPETALKLKETAGALDEKGISAFEKLSPEKQALLFEAVLGEYGGKMLDSRKTELEFVSDAGKAALGDCAEFISKSGEKDDMGDGKAAFSVMTINERREYTDKFPDAEIELAPLFGLKRLKTVAVAVSRDSRDQKRAFGVAEYLQTITEKLAALYKRYPAGKEITPLNDADKDAAVVLSQARPAPDLCGYVSLMKTYLPAAIDKAGKDVNAGDCLSEAAENASDNIWKGKRE